MKPFKLKPGAFPAARGYASTAVVAGGLLLAAVTLEVRGHGADAVAWAVVQVVLVAIAATDAVTRRIPNALTLTSAAAAVALRVLFARAELVETFAAAGICFAAFLLLAILSRGALGMGDVKLAGLLGLFLGSTVFPALLVGTFAGGVAALVVAYRTGSAKAALAYGPYLCLGGAVAIVALSPPPLVSRPHDSSWSQPDSVQPDRTFSGIGWKLPTSFT